MFEKYLLKINANKFIEKKMFIVYAIFFFRKYTLEKDVYKKARVYYRAEVGG